MHVPVVRVRAQAREATAQAREATARAGQAAKAAEAIVTDKPAKPDPRARLAELLGTDSTNFLGTGLSLREFSELHSAEKLAASWTLQEPAEKKRRRAAVIKLAIELGRIRETTEFSTRLAELAIEAVIEGDWKMVDEWAEHFAFNGERDEMRAQYAPVFAVFSELLLQALRARKEMPT